MVAERRFREDLYYRVNLITLHLPALRERRDDIPLLVRHFIREVARAQSIDIPEISSDAMEFLTRLPYPGNIRQLKNMVERAVLIGGGRLEKYLFESEGMAESEARPLQPSGTLDDGEKAVIADALARTEGNLTQASRILGITRQALYRRMEKHGISR